MTRLNRMGQTPYTEFRILPPRLDLDIYPYLPKALVETTKPASYMSLMTQVPA